jgi:hypothetical protein
MICKHCGTEFKAKTRANFCTRLCGSRSASLRRREAVPLPPAPEVGRWLVLNNGYFALVDNEDYDRVAHIPWKLQADNGYVYYTYKNKKQYLHRVILGCEELVDHKNHNKLDNRKHNLRPSTTNGSSQNRRRRPHNSKYKGVFLIRGKYRAKIGINYKSKYLGSFSNEEDAAHAYDEAARSVHGKFACVNFPRPGEIPAIGGQLTVRKSRCRSGARKFVRTPDVASSSVTESKVTACDSDSEKRCADPYELPVR